ncbi:MAG: alkaline phosphatase [Bacteroidales bacterium]|nr:alkaline phosphatase [Bacteroidales bacterium]
MKPNKITISTLVIIILILTFSCENVKEDSQQKEKQPKYIFLFIGDGMGINHVNLTQAYLKSTNDEIGFDELTMTQFPVFGNSTTYCKNRLITDSGAAGSAIACGEKANVGVISYFENENHDFNPTSIAKTAHTNGFKVGIISSVSIDHATPACFYAINESRGNYYDIGLQLPESNFEFFGGGGFKYPNGRNSDQSNLYELTQTKGYTHITDINEISKLSDIDDKILFTNPVLWSDAEMPYEIDRSEHGGYELAEIVNSGINYLSNENGFFIMVEGGKIDWAAHENDAATIINEVIAFDKAILQAYNFYLEHPDETLIIVTADHETGGISIGMAQNNYESNLKVLQNQKMSMYQFSTHISDYKESNNTYSLSEILNLANELLFETPLDFTDDEIEQIQCAFDYYFYKKTSYNKTELYNLYGDYNPIGIIFIKILQNRASVGFTSWSHTAASVPVFSVGVGSEKLTGNIDNTEFNKILKDLMNW